MEVRRRGSLYSEVGSLEGPCETGFDSESVSLKGPFESSKCYAFDKRKPVFNFTKGAFSKVDLGL